MTMVVVCQACGSLVLEKNQAQHAAFHQHHGHIQSVDFSPPRPWPARRHAKPQATRSARRAQEA